MKKIAICMSLLIGQAWALTCSAPVTISEPGQNVSGLRISMNEEGETLITWRVEDPNIDESQLVAATRNDEKKWSAVAISDIGSYFYTRKQLIDPKGNSFAFWKLEKENDEGGNSKVYQVAKKEKNKDWSSAVNMLDSGDMSDYPSMVLDSQANIQIFGKKEVKDPNDQWKTHKSLVAINYDHQNGQKKLNEITKVDGYCSSQRLIKNDKGDLFAIWGESISKYDPKKGYQTKKYLKGSWLNPSTGWSAPQMIFTSEGDAYLTAVQGAMNSKGDMVVVWGTSGGTDLNKLQALTYLDGQWSENLELDEFVKSLQDSRVLMNEQGSVVVCWRKKEKGKEVFYVADKPVGQPWSSSVALANAGKYAYGYTVSIDNQGNILVVWGMKEGKKEVIYMAEKPVGQPWASPVALSDPSKSARKHKLSTDDQGNTLIVWTLREGKKEMLYAAYKPVNQAWSSPVSLGDNASEYRRIRVYASTLGQFLVFWNEQQDRKSAVIKGAVLSTATKEWTPVAISPEGQFCADYAFKFNTKGQGIMAWMTTWDFEDTHIQVAELNLN